LILAGGSMVVYLALFGVTDEMTGFLPHYSPTVHSYADDSQLYFHADISVADDKVKQLLVCVEEISHWMNGSRLKINKDKTQ